jgi:hypothetical protein
MKLRNITIERLIIIIVTIRALIGWTRPFHPTAKNLNNTADKIVQENPNLAVVLYTVADALDEGYIHSFAVVSLTLQERFVLNSLEMPEKNKTDIDT